MEIEEEEKSARKKWRDGRRNGSMGRGRRETRRGRRQEGWRAVMHHGKERGMWQSGEEERRTGRSDEKRGGSVG